MYTHTAVADQQGSEKLLGRKITDLYGRDYVVWSDRKNDIASSNCWAELYRVKGFDPSYLVAVKRATLADHAVSVVDLYEHVNGFTVTVGSDLYQERLKLDQAVRVNGELCNLDGSVQGASQVLEEKAYSAWLQELMQARFLPVTETMEEDCKEGAKSYVRLSFAHENGVVQELFVYDNGMVCYGVGEYSFYQRIKAESVQELIRIF